MKKYFIHVVLCVLVMLGVTSCSNDDMASLSGNSSSLSTIQTYIEENDLEASSTVTGLHFIVEDSNLTGASVSPGSVVELYYDISVLDGENLETSFDTTQSPHLAKTGSNAILPIGLEEGLSLMREGEVYRFLIPSELAFASYSVSLFDSSSVLDVRVRLHRVSSESERNQEELSQIEDYVLLNRPDTLGENEDSIFLVQENIFQKIITDGDTSSMIDVGDSVNLDFDMQDLEGNTLGTFSGFPFSVGLGEVFEGLDLAVEAMTEGETSLFLMTSSRVYRESVLVIPCTLKEELATNRVIPAYAINITPFTPILLNCELPQIP